MTQRRYLFLCPDRTSASGGIAVIYDMVALLVREGRDAAILHNGASAGYPDYYDELPAFFTNRIRKEEWRWLGKRGRIARIGQNLAGLGCKARLRQVELRETDAIVIPEFMMAEALVAFHDQPLAVFVQNPFAFMRAYDRALQRGFDPAKRVIYWFGMSRIVERYLSLMGVRNTGFFPVSMKPQDFPYQSDKADLITYMPRKRPREARMIDSALRRRGRLGSYRLEALDRLLRTEVAEKLGESRIFISLLKDESLGFPAAEAMAAGCIVVGFDGLGGAEFFDETTGVPVEEGDVAALVVAVEQVIEEYAREPARLDAIRRHASEVVNARYSVEAFETGVLTVWPRFEALLG